jgi:hypothetical protein
MLGIVSPVWEDVGLWVTTAGSLALATLPSRLKQPALNWKRLRTILSGFLLPQDIVDQVRQLEGELPVEAWDVEDAARMVSDFGRYAPVSACGGTGHLDARAPAEVGGWRRNQAGWAKTSAPASTGSSRREDACTVLRDGMPSGAW